MVASDDLVRLATEAGELLLSFYGRIGTSEAARKGGRRRDLVSRADTEAERLILGSVPAGDSVLAEESGRRVAGDRCWIVDPLDGTINYLRGIPVWCVSIAVVDEGRLTAGVVHAPALQMTFAAERGAGATLNGKALRVSAAADIGDAVLATGFPYARDTVADNNLDNVPTLGLAAGGLRRLGSAALDLAFTAAGKLDGYWELHLNPWDVAAGTLLVREAGGRVTDFHGAEGLAPVTGSRHIVASNGLLHGAITGRLAPLRELA